jgi:hypothetical protein
MPLDRLRTARINALGTVAHMDTDIVVVAEAQTSVPNIMTTVVATEEADDLDLLPLIRP